MIKIYYSTSVFLKYYIQKEYFKDKHYVWCSEIFDNSKSTPNTPQSLIGPTSNPSTIYNELKNAVSKNDTHYHKIIEQKASLKMLSIEKHKNGEINSTHMDEIIYMVDNCDFSYWRPVIYLIPNTIDKKRIQTVPIDKRASFGPEYIISDLISNEFDILDI